MDDYTTAELAREDAIETDELWRLLTYRPAWHADAACREPHPGVTFFPERGQSPAPAYAICRTCLVRTECGSYAAEQEDSLYGIWGGESGRDRRRHRGEVRKAKQLQAV